MSKQQRKLLWSSGPSRANGESNEIKEITSLPPVKDGNGLTWKFNLKKNVTGADLTLAKKSMNEGDFTGIRPNLTLDGKLQGATWGFPKNHTTSLNLPKAMFRWMEAEFEKHLPASLVLIDQVYDVTQIITLPYHRLLP